MTDDTLTGPLIMGASGQIGRMLHQLWRRGDLDFGAEPIWQVRSRCDMAGHVLHWDVLHEPRPRVVPTSVICLAGGPHVATNAALARAAAEVADGKPLLYASTQAVYGPQQGLMTETSECHPAGRYGQEKLAAEAVLETCANATCLRIGNAIGADALLRSVQRGPVRLDQFADGQGPRRMMIGPLTLGRAFVDLIKFGCIPHPILNLAQPGLIAMSDLLKAFDADWHWVPAPHTAMPSLEMDLTRVSGLIDLPAANPEQLFNEVIAAGWSRTP